MEMKERLEQYVELYENLKATVGDDHVVCEVLNQIGKDRRCAIMRGEQPLVETENDGVSATSKQIGYLKTLGVAIPKGLTKQQASELIDQAAGK